MDRRAIKTFIIVLLLLVNLAFLTIMALDSVENTRLKNETRDDLLQVLSARDIILDVEELPEDEAFPQLYVRRDMALELEAVTAVLGPVESSNEGGGILYYTGKGGTGRFRSGGEFSLLPDERAYPAEDISAVAEAVMAELRISGECIHAEGDGQAGQVVYLCTVEKVPIFSCRIVFTFADGALCAVEGIRPLDTLQRYAPGTQIGAATAVIRLVGQRGDDFQRITAVLPGYALTAASGEGELMPVWKVVTDQSAYLVDRTTGDVATESQVPGVTVPRE